MYYILFVIQIRLCGSNSIIHLLIQFIMYKCPNWCEKKVRVRAVADSIRAEPHFTQPLPMNQPINYSFTSHVFIGGFLPTLDLGQEVKKEMGKVLMMNFSF